MINGQKEIWISTDNKSHKQNTIIAVSNCGRIMRKNGKIEYTKLRHQININCKHLFIHQFIALHFIHKTEDDLIKNRTCIDHIIHNPKNMNINDVRNMRWCTKAENNTFEEAKINMKNSYTAEVREKIGNANKNKPRSIFGKKFKEHFGFSMSGDTKLYNKERLWFINHGKCRWE